MVLYAFQLQFIILIFLDQSPVPVYDQMLLFENQFTLVLSASSDDNIMYDNVVSNFYNSPKISKK